MRSHGTGPEFCSYIPSQSSNVFSCHSNSILPSRVPNLPYEPSTASSRDTRRHHSRQRPASLPTFPSSQPSPHQHKPLWQRKRPQHANAASAAHDTGRASSRARERARGRGTHNANGATPSNLHNSQRKKIMLTITAQVNRLTRELTALRAHSASVASTASSASTFDITGPSHPTASRRHRSSSSTSQPHGIPLNSATANIPHHHHHHSHRPSLSGAAAEPITSTPSAASRHSSVGSVPLTPRYEDVALHRQELEEAKRENERLRRRVRELEALVRGRRASSVSTQTSVSNSGTESRDRSVSVQRRGPPGPGEEVPSRTGSVTGREILRDALRDD